nr:hypothetical protein [Rhodoblastus acidophilus]
MTRLEQFLYPVIIRLGDDLRHRNGEDFVFRVFTTVLIDDIPPSVTCIRFTGQNLVDRSSSEQTAAARANSQTIDMFGDGFHPHWPARSIAAQRQLEHETHVGSLDGIDLPFSLYFPADFVGIDTAPAVRGGGPIRKPQLRGRRHAAHRSDSRVMNLHFIYDAQHLAQEWPTRLIVDVFGLRDDPNTVPFEFRNGSFLITDRPKAAAQAMNQNRVERRRRRASTVEQRPKSTAIEV